jgi:hypothetical protein
MRLGDQADWGGKLSGRAGQVCSLPDGKSPTGEVGPFFGDCGEALHSDGAAFEKTV